MIKLGIFKATLQEVKEAEEQKQRNGLWDGEVYIQLSPEVKFFPTHLTMKFLEITESLVNIAQKMHASFCLSAVTIALLLIEYLF